MRSAPGRCEAIAAIRSEEKSRKQHHAVAGFDLTFSVPKSVSVLWGLADAGTQALIVAVHHEAVGDVLGMVEREVAATRSGVHGVVHEEVRAMCLDHFDSHGGIGLNRWSQLHLSGRKPASGQHVRPVEDGVPKPCQPHRSH